MAFTGIFLQPIPIDDQDRALAFYRDVIGMEVAVDAELDDDWRMVMMRLPGTRTKVQFARRHELSFSEEVPCLYLECEDLDAEAERLSAAGASFPPSMAYLPSNSIWSVRKFSTESVSYVNEASAASPNTVVSVLSATRASRWLLRIAKTPSRASGVNGANTSTAPTAFFVSAKSSQRSSAHRLNTRSRRNRCVFVVAAGDKETEVA